MSVFVCVSFCPVSRGLCVARFCFFALCGCSVVVVLPTLLLTLCVLYSSIYVVISSIFMAITVFIVFFFGFSFFALWSFPPSCEFFLHQIFNLILFACRSVDQDLQLHMHFTIFILIFPFVFFIFVSFHFHVRLLLDFSSVLLSMIILS